VYDRRAADLLLKICGNLRNLWISSGMAEHARFKKLVAEAKKNITEISPGDAAA